ncbi:unnamed protein product [Meganyctiphanes norvegica]|uniref:Alpha-L-iduronidase n=1 Tax=Meganyctiphanes norvegica TaxID=48144 RepID=A0AAV2PUM6_MEGNR
MLAILLVIAVATAAAAAATEPLEDSSSSSSSSTTATISEPPARAKVLVDAGHIEKPLEPFWGSTGLCPPDPHSSAGDFLLSLDERQNIALIGSLPHNAVRQVRIHWLLDLVNASISNGIPQWEFSHLDELLDTLHKHQLRPGFELMGNPGGIFTNLENSTQVQWWKDLVYNTANRYAGRYGLPYVESWLWESWNEPDHHDFDNLNITVQGFLNYWDASRAGLDAVSPTMVLGGPGGSCRDPSFSHICWALLDHCDQVGARIDFISFHKKGHEDWEYILEQELATIQKIRDNYPNLRDIPIINDESDFKVGWSRSYDWRSDARYATLMVNSIAGHLSSSIMSYNYHLMSLDNAFLSYQPWIFSQRTLMARFQINSTVPREVHLIKKPSYSIHSLLALLGDQVITSYVSRQDYRLTVLSTCRGCPLTQNTSDFIESSADPATTQTPSVYSRSTPSLEENSSKDYKYNSTEMLLQTSSTINAMSNWESTTVVSYSNGTNNTAISQQMDLTIQLPHQLLGEVLWMVLYSLGGGVAGPYETWMDQGQPKEPTRDQLAQLRASEGATRRGPQSVVGVAGELQLTVNLTSPEVVVVHICRPFDSSPGQVVNVNTLEVTSADVLITWSDENINTRCILSYEVQWAQQEDGPWSRISPGNVTDNNFVFSVDKSNKKSQSSVVGWYRVRAVTYWGTTGEFSDPVYLHQNVLEN